MIIKCIDLFCGIGGFRLAADQGCQNLNIETEWVFSSDIDGDAQATYFANFGEQPHGDITQINARDIPDHDIAFAGFPCQPFSICGDRKGFDDIRGTLFFNIAQILMEKRPSVFVLENVKQLVSHNKGHTFERMIEVLENIGYTVHYQILNALDFGIPHKRERVFIVGFRNPVEFYWPNYKIPMKPLEYLLEDSVSEFYYASEQIRNNRLAKFSGERPTYATIWHENKAGHISVYPYSCAMRAGASYNYLLVNGERRLTEREMLRLLGFPDSFKIVKNYSSMRKLTGNSVVIDCVKAVINVVLDALINAKTVNRFIHTNRQLNLPF